MGNLRITFESNLEFIVCGYCLIVVVLAFAIVVMYLGLAAVMIVLCLCVCVCVLHINFLKISSYAPF